MHPIYHGPAPRSATRLPGATVVGDFSKAMCLSGLRLGWIADREPNRLAGAHVGATFLAQRAQGVGEAVAATDGRCHTDVALG
jgi:hypothetical protein